MFLEPKQDYLGLDISDQSLKAVQFKRTLTDRLTLSGMSQIDLPAGVFNEGELKKPEVLGEAISHLIAKPLVGKFTTAYTVASLPDTKTFIKVVDIPPMSAEEIPQAVRYEAEHHIPIPIEETYWDWQQISTGEAANKRLPILLGVAPRAIVDSYTQALTAAKLMPTTLEIEAAAIVRSLMLAHAGPTSSAVMIIDIGAARTGLIVHDQNTIQFAVSLPISGQKITSTIATTLNLTEAQAEKAKILCGLDPKKCHGAMADILHAVMDDLVRRIRESIVFYAEHFPGGHKINKVILCGGGANFKSIDEYLGDKLEVEVKRGNPWLNLEPSPAPLKPSELIAYSTAIGLALRNFLLNSDHD